MGTAPLRVVQIILSISVSPPADLGDFGISMYRGFDVPRPVRGRRPRGYIHHQDSTRAAGPPEQSGKHRNRGTSRDKKRKNIPPDRGGISNVNVPRLPAGEYLDVPHVLVCGGNLNVPRVPAGVESQCTSCAGGGNSNLNVPHVLRVPVGGTRISMYLIVLRVPAGELESRCTFSGDGGDVRVQRRGKQNSGVIIIH